LETKFWRHILSSSGKLFKQIQMACADRVDNQFAGQLYFFQSAFLAGHHDFVKIFACLGRSHLGRLFNKGDGFCRASWDTNPTSNTAIPIHHRRLLFGRNAHRTYLAAFDTGTASFASVKIHGRIKVRNPKIQWSGEVLVNSQHPAAASAA
jgi:hypothetical protein